MKFYNSVGPNPRVVKMFMAEKGLDIPRVEVNLMAGENRQPAHVARNPTGQMPALELDDGMVLAEILPICEYLEEIQPTPPLIGTDAEARAITRMWTRRVDLNICEPMANGFRYSDGLRLFESRMRCIPAAAADLKAIAAEKLTWLDGQTARSLGASTSPARGSAWRTCCCSRLWNSALRSASRSTRPTRTSPPGTPASPPAPAPRRAPEPSQYPSPRQGGEVR
jgi:glutathione S-transferase